jgi:hypothetical protein
MLPLATRAALLAATLLVVPGALAAQSRDRDAERDAERREASRREYEDREDRGESTRPGARRTSSTRIDTTVSLRGRAEASLAVVAGRITVRGWDRPQARVRAESEGGALTLEHSSSRLAVRQDERGRGRGDDARIDVTVPYGTRLLLRTTSGDMSVVDVRGEVESRTVSGDVRIEGTRGRTLFESVSGEFAARSLAGPVRGESVSGEVTLEEVAGDVEVETVSGEISVNRARASFVRLESVSGEIDFGGPLDRAGRYEFNSHSGTITLGLAPDAGARVSVETFSGSLDTAFPLTLAPGSRDERPRRFEFTLGGGGARVTAESFSGDVNLRRTTSGSSTPRE